MIFTDYYRFERIAVKAKHRMDCVLSTESYPEFENKRSTKAQKETEKRDAIRVGDLIIYWGVPDSHITADKKRKADRSITIKSNNMSSVYNWLKDDDCWVAYGDVKGTTDALLFIYCIKEVDSAIQAEAFIEVFIARGKSNECNAICNDYFNGELDDEMNELRQRATFTNV
jgi:hypothetical protein